MAGETFKYELLLEEVNTLCEQGHILNKEYYKERINKYKHNQQQLNKIYKELLKTPISKEFKYEEPSSLEEIIAASDFEKLNKVNENVSYDKIYGAWLGRVGGCILGVPCEGFRYDVIATYLKKANAYPLKDYLPLTSKANEEDKIYLYRTHCCKDQFSSACSDDDIRFSILANILVEEKGVHFTRFDVAMNWMNHLPICDVWTAETQSYINFVTLDRPVHYTEPFNDKKTWDYVANYFNPYVEWIGAQIRIDTYGYIAANNPKLAAKMAYQEASFSHRKNGIYGAMYFATLISLAFSAKTIKEAVIEALKVVPKKSRFYEDMKKTIQIAENANSQDELIKEIVETFDSYHRVHTIPNAAIVVASLIYGKENYMDSMCLAIMMGKDTDCNGATIGSILGAFYGAKNTPLTLTGPLNDTCYSSLADYHPVKISALAQKTYEMYLKYKNEL